jgi:hypothetical protein
MPPKQRDELAPLHHHLIETDHTRISPLTRIGEVIAASQLVQRAQVCNGSTARPKQPIDQGPTVRPLRLY